MNSTLENLSAQELRAERARKQIALYELAARVGVHPARLGRMLNEREHLPPRIAQRIFEALQYLYERRDEA
jgi:hypothetical protein